MLRIENVIIIQIGDVMASRAAKAGVTRGGQAFIGKVPQIDNPLFLVQRADDMLDIDSAVVHNNDFKIWQTLMENALECFSQHCGAIVSWKDHRNNGCGGVGRKLSLSEDCLGLPMAVGLIKCWVVHYN